MNSRFDRISGLIAAYGLAAAVAVTSLVQLGRAQEVIPCPPPVGGRPANIEEHPILSHLRNLPHAGDYLHHVLVNSKGDVIIHLTKLPQPGSLLEEACPSETCCEEMLKRIGAGLGHSCAEHSCANELGVETAGDPAHTRHAIVIGHLRLQPGEIIDTRQIRTSERRPKASQFEPQCGSDCREAVTAGCTCEKCGCKECKCGTVAATADEAKCGEECVAKTLVIQHVQHACGDELAELHPLKLMQHIASLMAEKAAAEAALEVREESAEQLSELFEGMADLIAENAALNVRLEAQAEHTKLAEKMADLAAENARLKAHVELAAERMELTKAALSMTLENERLKLRLADLEQKHAAAEAARTAARPRTDRESQ
jgi:hypothetical protein